MGLPSLLQILKRQVRLTITSFVETNMTTLTKSTLALVCAVVIGGLIWGAYQYPKSSLLAGSTSGSSATQHIATFAFNPTTGSATSTSVLNSDTQDRVITGSNVFCSGVGTSKTAYTGTGLAQLLFSMATSSTASPNTLSNTNYVLSDVIATSSTEAYTASTTVTTPSTADYRRWAAGSYVTVASNATNTAACIVNVSYLQGLGV